MRIPLKYFKVAGATVVGIAVLLTGEVAYTLKRDFPLTDPPQPIHGVFGDPSLPPLRFVVLGDSTSVGVGTTPDKSFPWLLATWLGEKYHVTLDVVGVGGATTADVVTRQVDAALALKPDLALVEIGANDTTHAVPLRSVRKNIAGSLDRLQAGGVKVVVAGPPHMGTSPAFLQPLRAIAGWRGSAVERRIKEEALERNLPYIDLAAGTHDEFKNDPEKYYSVDWFHPGAGGYQLWAEVMYPTVLAEADRRP